MGYVGKGVNFGWSSWVYVSSAVLGWSVDNGGVAYVEKVQLVDCAADTRCEEEYIAFLPCYVEGWILVTCSRHDFYDQLIPWLTAYFRYRERRPNKGTGEWKSYIQ